MDKKKLYIFFPPTSVLSAECKCTLPAKPDTCNNAVGKYLFFFRDLVAVTQASHI